MDIPYTTAIRPDTGLYNGKFGIWLFLASEVLLFGALFSTYIFLRTAAPVWPPEGTPPLQVSIGMINTFVLIASSVTMVMSWAALKENRFGLAKRYLWATLLLALLFMVFKTIEYYGKFSHHAYPSTNTFLAIYFTLTGLHGLHVLGGIVVIGFLVGPGKTMWQSDPERYTNRIEITGLYWHFVDLVWIFLFPVLYLLS
jgi:heme/copper-type cytochrome/quinol oxidase subunit 3